MDRVVKHNDLKTFGMTSTHKPTPTSPAKPEPGPTPKTTPELTVQSSDDKKSNESEHSTISAVKEAIQDAVNITAQKLNLAERERNPLAANQDGKTNPE
ncbi:hypothetical protein G9A89_009166 [Geosiphon pyriformis]|nr:hypothetical protein G9A89_009166 [Geosiphon pyriformis]